jgi:hypothetical protein
LEWLQADIDSAGDPLVLARVSVVTGLVLNDRIDEAVALAGTTVTAAIATNNPASLASALFANGLASRLADPLTAMGVFRRGLSVARDSGNRWFEGICAHPLAVLEAEHGDPRIALDLFTDTINRFHDVGDTSSTRSPMVGVVAFLDRIGRHEPAAVIAGYAADPLTHSVYPELAATVDRLRGLLGDSRYAILTGQGQTMTAADAVRYTLTEIELARGGL